MHDEFFKVFVPQICSHRLLIPPAFQKHVEDNVPQKSTITTPANKKWIVSMERDGSNLFFKDGWQEFVNYHTLEFGDFLIFRYDGNSSFTVKLFGKNGCAKQSDVAGNCNKPSLIKPKPEETEVLLPLGKRETIRNIYGKMEKRKDECLGPKFAEKRKRGRPRKEDSLSFKGLKHGKQGTQVQQAIYDKKIEVTKPLALRHNCPALAAANRYVSSYPSFTFAVTAASVRRNRLYVPCKFVRNYIKGRSRDIYLLVSDKFWTVRLFIYPKYCGELTTGWRAFAMENDLQAGDVCIFELVGLPNVTLKVSIFRG
ncbi:hypothetical protein Ancab_026052 [Ancistrocladus abbreviatus]